MPYTVNACFDKFIQDTVNLVPERTNRARSSRDWLVSQIVNLANQGKIPPLYETNHIYYGSFARNTKIRPLDDIDMMVILMHKVVLQQTYLKEKGGNILFPQ